MQITPTLLRNFGKTLLEINIIHQGVFLLICAAALMYSNWKTVDTLNIYCDYSYLLYMNGFMSPVITSVYIHLLSF